jgi:hypothetical protein
MMTRQIYAHSLHFRLARLARATYPRPVATAAAAAEASQVRDAWGDWTGPRVNRSGQMPGARSVHAKLLVETCRGRK